MELNLTEVFPFHWPDHNNGLSVVDVSVSLSLTDPFGIADRNTSPLQSLHKSLLVNLVP